MAFGGLVALHRRVNEGGSWLVRISLAQVGRWLVSQGEIPESQLQNVTAEFTPEEVARWAMVSEPPMGKLGHLGPVLGLAETMPRWSRPSVPLGHHAPVWPERSK